MDSSSMRTRFPAWFARSKGIGRAPNADGERAVRATPEPETSPHTGQADRSPMVHQGQRTRSSRWSHDHPGRPGEPDTGQRGFYTNRSKDSRNG